MTTGAEWGDSVGRIWAEMYPQTDRSFSGLTERLLGRIAGFPGERILDIGCGAGELSLAIGRSRPHADVLGIDVSTDLIEAARQRGIDRSNVRFELTDAAVWEEPGFAPNLLVSRHGVMFFDDPPGAFRNLRAHASLDAHLVFSCFRTPRENRWASELAELIGLPPADPEAPGPFAFADPQRIEAILTEGNWGKIDIQPVDFAWISGLGADPVADALHFVTRIGPAAAALRTMEGAAREAATAKIAKWLEANRNDDMVAFPAAAWIVTASADRRHRKR